MEAWGDYDVTDNTKQAHQVSMNGVFNGQVALDNQRQQRTTTDLTIQKNSRYPQADQVGKPVTWADNRRQYAQPAEDANEYNGWNTTFCKPSPEMNGMTRGVHNKYSREKRIDAHTQDNEMGSITTDVDTKYYVKPGNHNGRPNYLDADTKYIPSTTPTPTPTNNWELAKPELGAPTAANVENSMFMDIQSNDYFMDTVSSTATNNKFTTEVITDPKIIAENRAARAAMASNTATNHATNNNNKLIPKIPDEIRELHEQIKALVTKVNTLEKKVTYVENNKSHDIILFIVIAIFILFVIDNIFKLSK